MEAELKYPNTRKIDIEKIDEQLSNRKGLYFWRYRDTLEFAYIGIALNKSKGLKTRIKQHLNPKFLEFRPSEQSIALDEYQLKHAIQRRSKKSGKIKYGIDRSSFRKKLSRHYPLKPGLETVNYIKNNMILEVFELENKELVKHMERYFIKSLNPKYNVKKT